VVRKIAKSFAFMCAIALATVVQAQEESAANKSGDDLRSAVQNPISSLISLPFKLSFDNGADNGDAEFLNIQPVVPVTVGGWNLVNRAIVPLVNAPGGIPGLPNNPGIGSTTETGKVFGLGDINYSLFLNPVETKMPFIWGAGASITLDTATDDRLGSGKWSAGPTAIMLVQPGWGTYGGLVRQLWSFAGDDARQDVNNMLLEPFVNYNLEGGWYLLTDSVITVNWDAPSDQAVTLPLGGGAGKLFLVGDQPMQARVEAYYNVIKPDAGPNWTIGATIQWLFPK
jgi:hypothetical protein